MKILMRAAACLLGVCTGALACAAPQSAVYATWHKHEINFTYMGFTSYYSCDGIESRLKLLLRLAGARPDAKVRVACTSPVGRPQRSSMTLLSFHSLTAGAGGGAKSGAQAAVAGVWKEVAWRVGSPRELDAGDCELVEQFAQRILPLFATRNVENHTTCVPHQVDPWGINLRFTVLAPAPAPKSK